MVDSNPRLFTIPAGEPFLACLVQTLVDDAARCALFGACALEEVTLLLPTRRAAREIEHIFLAEAMAGGADAVLMPHIAPLGDIDEDEFANLNSLDNSDNMALPPAINAQARHFRLLPLVRAQAKAAGQPLDGVRLSGLAYELEAFFDDAQNQGIDFSALSDLVPDELAENWQQTFDFLSIVTQAWPQFLAEEGLVDPTQRRNLILQRRTQNWTTEPPSGPVLAAGSTGSIRATADLLKAIADLPRGGVVLPGLDKSADAEVWKLIEQDPSHPQYGLSQLLRHIGTMRDAVHNWPNVKDNNLRAGLLNQALVPVQATAGWAECRPSDAQIKAAFDGLSVLHAPDQRAEAGAIGVAMRGVLETPDATAALVTRDRDLARRVSAELARWDIEVDDSAGRPLNRLLAAGLARFALTAVAENLAPVSLLALLKHPLVCLGRARGSHLHAVRQMEIEGLRGPRPAPGLQALHTRCPDAGELLERLGVALDPLLALKGEIALRPLLDGLTHALEYLTSETDAPSPTMWSRREDGRALAQFFETLYEHGALAPSASLAEWTTLIDFWMGRQSLRRGGKHRRLFIWSPLEARLMQTDLMILGGLNEANWPPLLDSGPWLSRPMRAALGMAQPERQIGAAAHDFVQVAAAPRVLLTRAQKVDGAPGVAARWLRRLETLCGKLPQAEAQNYLAWWQQLDATDKTPTPIDPPAPCPPLKARPNTLSVTQIETLLRDPYKIYAQKVLDLRELEAIDAPPAATHRGSFLHKLFENLLRQPIAPGEDIAEKLLLLAAHAAQQNATGAAILKFWQARLEATAKWFADFDSERRGDIVKTHVEVSGRLQLDLPANLQGEPFTITAKADRIDVLKNGQLAIFDYKTGAAPSKTEIENHYAVQMTLQAAMAAAGGFDDVAAAKVAELAYLSLSGRTPPGVCHDAMTKPHLPRDAIAMVSALVMSYRQKDRPYWSHIRPSPYPGHTAFDHLARLKEWQHEDGGGG